MANRESQGDEAGVVDGPPFGDGKVAKSRLAINPGRNPRRSFNSETALNPVILRVGYNEFDV